MDNALNTWGLRLAIAGLGAFAVWDLWHDPDWIGVVLVVYSAVLLAWSEQKRVRLRWQARERAWALAATSDDPIRSMAVSMFLQSRTLKEIGQIAEWRAEQKPLGDPDAPPAVQQYHAILASPPREP